MSEWAPVFGSAMGGFFALTVFAIYHVVNYRRLGFGFFVEPAVVGGVSLLGAVACLVILLAAV